MCVNMFILILLLSDKTVVAIISVWHVLNWDVSSYLSFLTLFHLRKSPFLFISSQLLQKLW